jgi:hypothetical protein
METPAATQEVNSWLAKIQAVAKGKTDADLTRVSYDLYEQR